MTSADRPRTALSLAGVAALALLVLIVVKIASVLFLAFIAILVAVYLSALTDWLCVHLRMPRPVGLAAAVLATAAGIAGMLALLVPPVVAQVQDLIRGAPDYLERLDAVATGFASRYSLPSVSATEAGSGLVGDVISDAGLYLRNSIVPYVTAGGTFAVEVASVAAMAIYLALKPDLYSRGAITLFPPRHRELVRTVFDDLSNTLRAWISAQLLSMVVLAVFTVLGLVVLRVPYALAFGVFTGIAAIVPFFGSVSSTLLPALFVVATGGWVHALLVVLLGVVIHLVEANIVAPLIFAQRLHIPPVLTIVAILLMATLFGILGLLVAVPMLAAGIVVIRHCVLGAVYGDEEARGTRAAVLVPTAEVSAIPFSSREKPA